MPQVITLLRAEGVSGVQIADLSLVHAAVDMAGFLVGDCDGQAASNLRSGAVEIRCGGPCTGPVVTDVEIGHVGGFAVAMDGAVAGASLSRLLVHDVGAGGLRIGSSNSSMRSEDMPSGLSLLDSTVRDGGHVYRMGPGLLLAQCHGCEVSHNDISGFFCKKTLGGSRDAAFRPFILPQFARCG